MSPVRFFALGLLALILLGCSRPSPDEQLNRSLTELQEAIEARTSERVLKLLHPEFNAHQPYDRDWARRTMALLFLQHQRIQVLVLNQTTQIDPIYSGQARTEAQVTLSGAERFIPDSTRYYRITLDWLEDDGDWRVHRLSWE